MIIPVAALAAVASAIALTCCKQMLIEYQQVEDSLAQVRTYWAAMGQANYVFSRTVQSGAGSDQGYAAMATGYLAELSAPASTGSGALTWQYPDVSPSYRFVSTPSVAVAASGKPGEMVITFNSAPAAGVMVAALGSLASSPALGIGYCVVAKVSAPCGPMPDSPNTYYQQVTYVHRPP